MSYAIYQIGINTDKEVIKFDVNEIEEYKFHPNKSPISINHTDINKIGVANKLLFGKQGFKYFIGYKNPEKIRPLCIFCPQMIIYNRNFDENRHIDFLKKEKKFLLNISKNLAISSKTNLIVNL